VIRRLALVVPAAAALAAGCGVSPSSPPPESPATVQSVVDGDTIAVSIGGRRERVRLLGIDTPELHGATASARCFGPQAAARARSLLPHGTRVRLVADPSQDRRDRYGRLLAYVYAEGADTSVNERLVAEGDARVYVFDPRRPFRQAAAFRRAEAGARAADRGLWASCVGPGSGTSPAGPLPGGADCPSALPIKGNLPSRVFHAPGDRSYAATRPERCFATTADAARAGFRPAR
jgi:micrococcal nuclease